MGTLIRLTYPYHLGLSHHPCPKIRVNKVTNLSTSSTSSTLEIRRRQGLEQVDKELAKRDERAALSIVKDLQGKSDGLRCFGAARQLPQRLYTLDELKLNGIDTLSLLSPFDATLASIERNLQIAALLGGVGAWNAFGPSAEQILFTVLGLLFLWTVDAVSFNGGIGFLLLDTIGHTFSQKYHNRVTQHEAGHFLIAYLLGILPRGYTLTSLDALKKEGSFNVQAGTSFVDYEFLDELDGLMKSLGFTQKKVDSQVRWAVLNTIILLRRHKEARAKLADAMSAGKSVGSCIVVIEEFIDDADLQP